MKVIKVGNDVFIGELDGNNVTNAIGIGKTTITAEITSDQFAKFLCARNIGKLISMTLSAHSDVGSRDFYEEEVLLLADLEGKFAIAEKRALKDLVNKYFTANF